MGFDVDDAFTTAVNRLATPVGALLVVAIVAVRSVEAASRDVASALVIARAVEIVPGPEGNAVAALEVLLRRGLADGTALSEHLSFEPSVAFPLWVLAFVATMGCFVLAVQLFARGPAAVRELALGSFVRWTLRLSIAWILLSTVTEVHELWTVTAGDLWTPAVVTVPMPLDWPAIPVPPEAVVGGLLSVVGFVLLVATLYVPAAIVAGDRSITGAFASSAGLAREHPVLTVLLPIATVLVVGLTFLFVAVLLFFVSALAYVAVSAAVPYVWIPQLAFDVVGALASTVLLLLVLGVLTRAYCDATDRAPGRAGPDVAEEDATSVSVDDPAPN